MSQQRTLLIEIGTEELPPKSLLQLSQAFSAGVVDGLNEAGLTCESHHSFATPRRIAVRIEGLPESQPDRESERRGPALQAAFDADGKPTKAAEGFARSCGVEVDQLRTLESDKGSWLVYTVAQEGKATATLLQDIVAQALAKLPINKRMRWGGGDAEFVRPVHWVCAVFGSEIVPIDVFGISAGATTVGHRFHANSNIEVDADSYEQALHDVGRVIADFDQRKALIRQQIETSAKAASAQAMIDADLLDEVTALVEWPVAVTGEFDPAFLTLPPEVLITTLQDNQKYFPLYDADGELLSKFITIANIESRNPAAVQDGNERVVRPRLADAMFFWEQDRKHSLESRVEVLDTVLFQKQLGSVAAKSRRVAEVAAWLSAQLSVDGSDARRAAQLGKCDLMTDMVGEFPSLQGVMGEYYARHDNEPKAIAVALREQYMPRHASDALPQSALGQVLAVAERIDTLVGIFAIGQKPTGVKDPFALRRAALGALRVLIECELSVDLQELIAIAAAQFESDVQAQECADELLDFMLERLRAYYLESGVSPQVFDAVLANRPTSPLDFSRRLLAVQHFAQLPEAESLAAANKRTRNILKKVENINLTTVDESLFEEAQESELYASLKSHSASVQPAFESGDYASALKILAGLREPIDAFFDGVMVNADDENVRNNRLALLRDLSDLFGHVADISRLSGA